MDDNFILIFQSHAGFISFTSQLPNLAILRVCNFCLAAGTAIFSAWLGCLIPADCWRSGLSQAPEAWWKTKYNFLSIIKNFPYTNLLSNPSQTTQV
jgi:hypothetical protein